MGMTIVVKGIGDLAASLERRRQRTASQVGDAIQLSAKMLRDAQLDLARSPFRRRGLWRNVQDAPRRFQVSGNALVDARLNAGRTEARILTKAHITTARSKAIKAVFDRAGQRKQLFRSELWVRRGRLKAGQKRSHKGHESRAGLQRVALSSLSRKKNAKFSGSIREWAEPKDLHKRDTVRLRGDALRIIIAAPVIKRNKSKILAHIQRAARKGMS